MAKCNFPNKCKSHGAKSGKYGEWLIVKMPFSKNSFLTLIVEMVYYRVTSANLLFTISWPRKTNTPQPTLHNTKIKHSTDRLALWNELFVLDSLRISIVWVLFVFFNQVLAMLKNIYFTRVIICSQQIHSSFSLNLNQSKSTDLQ